MIIGSAGMLMLAVGVALACRAEKCAAQAAATEHVAGCLIIGGLTLIGIGVDWAFDLYGYRVG